MRSKKEYGLLAFTAGLLLLAGAFALWNWDSIVCLFQQMLTGVSIVREYVLSLGVAGVLVITLIIIVCFFVPVISSIPVQLASAISYGLPFGIVHVILSVFLASQLAFLFTRCIRVFQSPKQRKKQQEMEERIQNSSRSMLSFLLPRTSLRRS